MLVIDAFVPRPVAANPELHAGLPAALRRRHPGALEARRAAHAGCNRIERRYEVLDARGVLQERIDIAEDIRPYAPDALRERLRAAGFAVDATVWDYGEARPAAGARFVTYVARPPRAAATAKHDALAQGIA